MDSVRGQQLNEIIALSGQMLEAAEAMDWARVAELEVDRRQRVAVCFQQPAGPDEAPAIAASIREILRLNERVAELTEQHRTRLGGEIQAHRVGRNASAAYLNHLR